MKKVKIVGIFLILVIIIQAQSIVGYSLHNDPPEAKPTLYSSYHKPLPFTVYLSNYNLCNFFVTVIFGNIEMIAEVDPGGEVLKKVNFIIDGVTVASFDPNPSQMYYFNWTRDIQLPGGFFACSHYIELQVIIKNGESEHGFPALRFF